MAIRPTAFNDDGSMKVFHDEAGHGGTIAEADIKFAVGRGGVEDLRYIVLKCPGCNAMTTHPVSGGCDPEGVAEMFVRKFQKASSRAPLLPSQAIRSRQEAIQAVLVLTEEMDGPERRARIRAIFSKD